MRMVISIPGNEVAEREERVLHLSFPKSYIGFGALPIERVPRGVGYCRLAPCVERTDR